MDLCRTMSEIFMAFNLMMQLGTEPVKRLDPQAPSNHLIVLPSNVLWVLMRRVRRALTRLATWQPTFHHRKCLLFFVRILVVYIFWASGGGRAGHQTDEFSPLRMLFWCHDRVKQLKILSDPDRWEVYLRRWDPWKQGEMGSQKYNSSILSLIWGACLHWIWPPDLHWAWSACLWRGS